MSELVLTHVTDRVMTIRFNRADKKNALTGAMYSAAAQALRNAATDADVRAVVLTGNDGVFCAGNDLQDFLQAPPVGESSPVVDFMRTLSNFEKPIIAAIYGPAIGIGVTLLLHVDLAYAGEKTRLQLPFVSLGLCAEFASSTLIPRLIGHARAAELLMLGEPFTAATALELGLVNAVVPDADVEAHALKIARKLAALPPQALRTTKMLMRRWDTEHVQTAISVEMESFSQLLKAPESKEAMSAFMEKRKPDFSKFS